MLACLSAITPLAAMSENTGVDIFGLSQEQSTKFATDKPELYGYYEQLKRIQYDAVERYVKRDRILSDMFYSDSNTTEIIEKYFPDTKSNDDYMIVCNTTQQMPLSHFLLHCIYTIVETRPNLRTYGAVSEEKRKYTELVERVIGEFEGMDRKKHLSSSQTTKITENNGPETIESQENTESAKQNAQTPKPEIHADDALKQKNSRKYFLLAGGIVAGVAACIGIGYLIKKHFFGKK